MIGPQKQTSKSKQTKIPSPGKFSSRSKTSIYSSNHSRDININFVLDIDINKTYANVITSTYLDGGAIPIIMNTDKDAINLASKTVNRVLSKNLKIVRITNTLELSKIQISERLYAEALKRPENFEILSSEPMKFKYDSLGKIFPI